MKENLLIDKSIAFASPVYWIVLGLGNVAFLAVMAVICLCRLKKSKKK